MIRLLGRLLQRALQLGLFLLLLALAINNAQEVTLHLLWGHAWSAPLILILLVVFVAGVLVGWAAWLPSRWKARREARLQSDTPPLASPPVLNSEVPRAD